MNSNDVTVLTRTRDRPLLIGRAIESVLRQTYGDWKHIIVNDGGDRDRLEEIIQQFSPRYGDRLKVIHNATSIGAVRALNLGMEIASTKYVITHDDDDSWEPTFLEKSIKALNDHKLIVPNTRGVISYTYLIRENIQGNSVVERYRYSLNGWVKTVGLIQLSATNFIPPISFLFERDVFSEIGFFRNLKFGDDWDFYIRFISKYEIAVLPEHLANYHIRPRTKDVYGNTAAVGADEHEFIITALRNDLIRHDLASGRFGLGSLVALSNRMPLTGNMKHRIWGLWRETVAKWNVTRLLRKRKLSKAG